MLKIIWFKYKNNIKIINIINHITWFLYIVFLAYIWYKLHMVLSIQKTENIEWNKWAIKWDEAKEGEWA